MESNRDYLSMIIYLHLLELDDVPDIFLTLTQNIFVISHTVNRA